MKLATLLLLGAFSGGYSDFTDTTLIDRLDDAIQRRFAAPPDRLGMSRVAIPSSFGGHFQPVLTTRTDFRPESPAEWAVIRDLESRSLNVGLYVFGAAVTRAAPEARDFRALKGPAAITPGTIRPAWYPPLEAKPSSGGALPDWEAVYGIARQAMEGFERGQTVLESSAGQWRAVARAVPASSPSCVGCHNHPRIGRMSHPLALHQAVGGVLYLYRRS